MLLRLGPPRFPTRAPTRSLGAAVALPTRACAPSSDGPPASPSSFLNPNPLALPPDAPPLVSAKRVISRPLLVSADSIAPLATTDHGAGPMVGARERGGGGSEGARSERASETGVMSARN